MREVWVDDVELWVHRNGSMLRRRVRAGSGRCELWFLEMAPI